mgnify:CR=1 FL=1
MSRKDKDVHALTLVKLLDHLRQNVKASETEGSYRRREAYRCQIALGRIQDWLDMADEKLTLDKNKK